MLHGNGNGAGEGHRGQHGLGRGMHGIQPMHLPPARTQVEDVADGARITFTPVKSEDVQVLQSKLRSGRRG